MVVTARRTAELAQALNSAPKGAEWKMGERVKWYEEPEEARA